MTTATLDPPATDATVVEGLMKVAAGLPPGRRAVVEPVTWEEYHALMDAREAAGRHFRLTYDRGSLEIMSTSNLHERLKKLLALLIEGWLDETGGHYVPSGGVTIDREDLDRGFEPDECYYVQNWSAARGLGEIDFAKLPPDLTVEAEVSRSAVGRLPLFAAFRVPEVWRYDGKKVTILLLGPDGAYHESATSRAIPAFPFADAPRFLATAATDSFADISRAFRAWVRALPPAAPPA